MVSVLSRRLLGVVFVVEVTTRRDAAALRVAVALALTGQTAPLRVGDHGLRRVLLHPVGELRRVVCRGIVAVHGASRITV